MSDRAGGGFIAPTRPASRATNSVSSDRHYVQITGPAAVSQAPAGRHERLSKQLSGRSVVRGGGAEEREKGPEDDSGGSRAGLGCGGWSRNNSFRGGATFRHVVLNIELGSIQFVRYSSCNSGGAR